MTTRLLLAATAALAACTTPATDGASSTADAPPKMGPQFYRVTGHGASAYLFGTVHLDHELTRNLPAPVEAAFTDADAVYVELAPSKEEVGEFMAMTLLEDGLTLDAVVGEELWAEIGDFFETAGQPRAAADGLKPMKPWAALSMLPSASSDGGPVLDKRLSMLAREEGKNVHGLETIVEQLHEAIDQTQDEAIDTLRDFIHESAKPKPEPDEPDESDDSMIQAWASGDSDRLFSLPIPGAENDEEARAKILAELWKRNEIMTERLDAGLRKSPNETAFVAVGTLHLPNPPGVDAAEEAGAPTPRRLGMAELLRQRGYTVTRINLSQHAPHLEPATD